MNGGLFCRVAVAFVSLNPSSAFLRWQVQCALVAIEIRKQNDLLDLEEVVYVTGCGCGICCCEAVYGR
jgi:hypothetical protein